MATINKRAQGVRAEAHANFMGGPSYDINDPILRLRVAASSSFFGEPMYYHKDTEDKVVKRYTAGYRLQGDQLKYLCDTLHSSAPMEWRSMSPASLMEKAIDDALDFSVEKTLQEAVRLRNDDHMRATPQVILVRAANHKKAKGTGLVRKYGIEVVKRLDETCTGMSYQLTKYGEDAPIPNSLKRVWSDVLEKTSEYHMAKYRMENREVKLVDVVNLVHPKSDVVSKLVKGELKNEETWEAILSANGPNDKKAAWIKALDIMGHMSIVKNLRNLNEAGVDYKVYGKAFLEGAAEGKQLPFRYYSAYQAVKDSASPAQLDGLNDCLFASMGNLPEFKGRVMSLCDNSGSAKGATTSSMGKMQVSSIGNLTGIITGLRSEEGYVGVFGDELREMTIPKKASIFQMVEQADALGAKDRGETENGIWLFWDKAIREKQHWDHVFVYSDMQAGHGGLYGVDGDTYKDFVWGGWSRGAGHQYIDVPKLINAYRSKVNPKVMVYLVQIAGHQDTIIPEFYDRTYILGGWSEGILWFAAKMAGLYNTPKQ
jgi:hypothetical protein